MIVNAFYAGSEHKEFLSSSNSRKDVLGLDSDDAQNADWVELVNRIRDTGISTKEDQKVMYNIWADWGIMLDDYFPEADIGSHDINVANVVDEILEEAKKAHLLPIHQPEKWKWFSPFLYNSNLQTREIIPIEKCLL